MTDIRFYHTADRSVLSILPELLQKALTKGQQIIVRTSDAGQAQIIDDELWAFTPDSFLPHSQKDGSPVTVTFAADKNAPILFATPDVMGDVGADIELCCILFDGREDAQVTKARTLWKSYKDDNVHSLTYWQQDMSGKWEKKA